jgi:hypothetical protein
VSSVVKCDSCGAEHDPVHEGDRCPWLVVIGDCGAGRVLHACGFACCHAMLVLAEASQAAGN